MSPKQQALIQQLLDKAAAAKAKAKSVLLAPAVIPSNTPTADQAIHRSVSVSEQAGASAPAQSQSNGAAGGSPAPTKGGRYKLGQAEYMRQYRAKKKKAAASAAPFAGRWTEAEWSALTPAEREAALLAAHRDLVEATRRGGD